MNRFEMPESMKLASIWVVWGILAIGALGWALFVVLDFFGVKEQSGWAQAIGTVLAVIGAGYFPIWHEIQKERREKNRWLCVLLESVDTECILLQQLRSALRGLSTGSVTEYKKLHPRGYWTIQGDVLSAIPLWALTSHQIQMVGECKVAVGYALGLLNRFDQIEGPWDEWIQTREEGDWVDEGVNELDAFIHYCFEFVDSLRKIPGVTVDGYLRTFPTFGRI